LPSDRDAQTWSDELDEPSSSPEQRYEDRGLLGRGGMGEVRRVYDRQLRRTMAMKVMHGQHQTGLLARFIEEAQCAAQLQHPGIVPVHELGELPDGRWYFTMREVQGHTLTEVLPSWPLRRLVDALQRVCEAVAYAHDQGVVHRDLKPDNIMLGPHGEVLVVDWGLAKVVGSEASDPVVTDRSAAAHMTHPGAVAGTPAYMAPEQARGHPVDRRTDVYALGTILYEVLGRTRAYSGDAQEVLEQVLAGPPAPLPPDPPQLVQACAKAMARTPAERFPDAGGLGRELRSWLDGEQRREQALQVAERAAVLAPEVLALRARAAQAEERAQAILAEVESWQPAQAKARGWEAEDEAAALRREADRLDLEAEQALQAALRIDEDLAEAHAALALRYRGLHAAAEAVRDAEGALRHQWRLGTHLSRLPADHPVRLDCSAYVQGDGALSLRTEPPAEVLLHRYELQMRHLVPVFERSLGAAPLDGVPLPMGSYLCLLLAPGRPEVSYPVHIRRQGHWQGEVRLPASLGPTERFVPSGWFLSGGGDVNLALPLRRVWVAGFVIQAHQVTNAEYLAFLQDLVDTGRTEDALALAPRERAGTEGQQGALIYGWDGEGFSLVGDADGDAWQPDWPVLMVDHRCALAYAEWLSERSGLPWRLPGELEWEKAARGVDGRFFPWGDEADPSWYCMRDSHSGKGLVTSVLDHPVDCSPYGVRGMAGNARDWCADAFEEQGPRLVEGRLQAPAPGDADSLRTIRGGAWSGGARDARCSYRARHQPQLRHGTVGFRLCRSLEDE